MPRPSTSRPRSYLKEETDLAVIVTPRLVRPARPGDAVKTPLDNTLPANDPDFFLTGKAEIPRAEMRAAIGAERPFSGHVLDLPKPVVLDLPKGGSNVIASKN